LSKVALAEAKMTSKLKEIVRRAEAWPEADQDEAAEMLLALEAERTNPPPLSEDDIEALRQSAEDVKHGRFATEASVREILDRYRK
jgi:hypothetical protein